MADSVRVAVIGTGAIGSFYGGKLAVGGRDVHFLVRGGFDQIKRFGIRIRGRKENFHLEKAQFTRPPRRSAPVSWS
jgi:2-dehydropantoate 2-reductase